MRHGNILVRKDKSTYCISCLAVFLRYCNLW